MKRESSGIWFAAWRRLRRMVAPKGRLDGYTIILQLVISSPELRIDAIIVMAPPMCSYCF